MIDPEIAKLIAAGIALVGSMVAVVRFSVGAQAKTFEKILAQQAAREIAERKMEEAMRRDMLDQQTRITMILDNHLGTIAINQAKTAQSLDLIGGRLLDAALRQEGHGA